MSTMLTELQGLLNLAKSLEPNDNGKNHQWSTLKDAVVKEIAHYSRSVNLHGFFVQATFTWQKIKKKEKSSFYIDGNNIWDVNI